ncbi:xanthine dehydrogenase family protein molybdopterin-binding subunit [Pseudovibrio sp. SPO723]|uniref:xanthine dehydrogenase family protein molybdopterin-binding subunit n=1 Tax=Nesiotobacter zosterae TaxID=392721 RepID=UPI0029C30A14|nr:xanthine dehydrogenase family protein molybdopterin-binding subunit [Pseudovibrio sp. SPO723]MDX5594106.1 xanthine dehydrogenase family protein molybdopterin-binding subunit [Pseudovibrio sp. SPO723]
MNTMMTQKFGIGAPVRRKEDTCFLTGKGRYTDDIKASGQVFGFMLRSPVAFARFKIEDIEEARGLEGVHLILTAADLDGVNLMPCEAVLKQIDGTKHPVPPREVLCSSMVRHVGDAIAFIVADTAEIAKTAAELIQIDYEDLPPAIGSKRALQADTPLVWPEFGTNTAFVIGQGDEQKTEAAFEKAAHVTSIEVVNNRLVANYMETRSCIGEYSPEDASYTLTTGTQGVHDMRDIIADDILHIDRAKLRVITPDVGGGFGTKIFCYREYPLCLIASRKLGRPVKWTGERTDHFVTDSHGRDNVSTAELALDAAGRILGLKVHVIADMGAYLHQFGAAIPRIGTSMSPGLYDIPAVWAKVTGVYTNTVPTDAYRGAGRPEAAYLIERLVDKAASEIGMDSVSFRKLNFIKPEQFPYTTQLKRMYDTGDFSGHLSKAMEEAQWDTFSEREAESLSRGMWRGIGVSSYIEACAFPGGEEATVELNEDGTVTLFIGTQTNGQGHATAYGQVVAQELGLTLEEVELVQGDTARIRKGDGTGGSRSIPLGLTSTLSATKTLARQIKELASEKLEVGLEDLELAEGVVRVVGTDQRLSFSEVAALSPDKLRAIDEVKQAECTYPNGTHICELEIDPETGIVQIENYVIVDDFGVTVNPLLLQGQVHGGAVQAISQALCERTVYDDDGQLLTASLLDYQLARAADMPSFNFQTHNVPSTTNALGIKGAGEAGTIGACAAVMNALNSALQKHGGVEQIDMPATPERVWMAIQKAKA